jgi:hypothetical protein
MDTKIKPGYTAPAAKADYTAIAQAVSEHNDAAQPGQHYWGVALADGTYMVYEAGTVPPPPTAEELAAKEAERKKAEAREKLPDTVAALQEDNKTLKKENEMLKQCLLEMSEIVYA